MKTLQKYLTPVTSLLLLGLSSSTWAGGENITGLPSNAIAAPVNVAQPPAPTAAALSQVPQTVQTTTVPVQNITTLANPSNAGVVTTAAMAPHNAPTAPVAVQAMPTQTMAVVKPALSNPQWQPMLGVGPALPQATAYQAATVQTYTPAYTPATVNAAVTPNAQVTQAGWTAPQATLPQTTVSVQAPPPSAAFAATTAPFQAAAMSLPAAVAPNTTAIEQNVAPTLAAPIQAMPQSPAAIGTAPQQSNFAMKYAENNLALSRAGQETNAHQATANSAALQYANQVVPLQNTQLPLVANNVPAPLPPIPSNVQSAVAPPDLDPYMAQLNRMGQIQRQNAELKLEIEQNQLRANLQSMQPKKADDSKNKNDAGPSPYVLALVGSDHVHKARIMVPGYGEMLVKTGDSLPNGWQITAINDSAVMANTNTKQQVALPFYAPNGA